MRAVTGYIILAGLASALSSCGSPYYAARPAPVYYQPPSSGNYYPAQGAGVYADREAARSSTTRRVHKPDGEQNQATGQAERHQGTRNDSGWIDPEP